MTMRSMKRTLNLMEAEAILGAKEVVLEVQAMISEEASPRIHFTTIMST